MFPCKQHPGTRQGAAGGSQAAVGSGTGVVGSTPALLLPRQCPACPSVLLPLLHLIHLAQSSFVQLLRDPLSLAHCPEGTPDLLVLLAVASQPGPGHPALGLKSDLPKYDYWSNTDTQL